MQQVHNKQNNQKQRKSIIGFIPTCLIFILDGSPSTTDIIMVEVL